MTAFVTDIVRLVNTATAWCRLMSLPPSYTATFLTRAHTLYDCPEEEMLVEGFCERCYVKNEREVRSVRRCCWFVRGQNRESEVGKSCAGQIQG